MKFDLGSLPGRLGKGLQRVFGSANKRALARYYPMVTKVNALEAWARGLDEAAVKARVAEWRSKVQGGSATLDDALPEMFALTRVASERTIGLRHFDVQLIGGAVLHEGKIAEMATGEGKTLVATLAATLNALSGKGVYIVTVNDYLAQRDRDWMAPIYDYLGISSGAIQTSMAPQERLPFYGLDIVYGTNNEFGFDYLRDNMKWRPEEQVQKRMHYAIVDEVDSILIDEARTPLIISGAPEGKAEKYKVADRIARNLKEAEIVGYEDPPKGLGTPRPILKGDFEVKLKEHQCLLTEEGIEKAERMVGVDSFYSDPANMDWPHHLEQALRAHHIYERDKDYVVHDDPRTGEREVIIVDEFTGRLMHGRRWSDGLHQAVEAKEGISPREESMVLATITLQNYFRMFAKLAGMTGTAMTEAAEFSKIYKLDVVAIPTNAKMVRPTDHDQIYLDEESKVSAIVDEVKEAHAAGRPLLLGTTSIAKSEKLSDRLKSVGIPHEVLNAKQHAREAEIIAQAGRKGAVTVATNMAGRGTDILLGGNPDSLWKREVKARAFEPDGPEAKALKDEIKRRCQDERAHVLSVGGLYVIGTERHESRRIDNQLRGRCGRQGDPGASKFFLCFDDQLMKIFARDWVKTMMERLGLKPGELIESPMVSRGIERAQKKVEMRNFDIRKNLLEYDEVMDKQRKFIYSQRQEVLELRGLRDKVVGMYEQVLEPIVETNAGDIDKPVNYEEIRRWLQHKCGPELALDRLEAAPRDQIFEWIMKQVNDLLAKRQSTYGDADWDRIQQYLLLDTIDQKWKDHLHAMDVLKAGIGLRGFAQVDPKNEFKKEGYEMFELLKQAIAEQVTDLVFKVEMRRAPAPAPATRRASVPRPTDPATALLMAEAMIAAGQAPPEVLEAVSRGAKLKVNARGEVVLEMPPAAAAPGAAADQPVAARPMAPATAVAESVPAAASDDDAEEDEVDEGGARSQEARKKAKRKRRKR
jgi:preprotein translocase subunit SecA